MHLIFKIVIFLFINLLQLFNMGNTLEIVNETKKVFNLNSTEKKSWVSPEMLPVDLNGGKLPPSLYEGGVYRS